MSTSIKTGRANEPARATIASPSHREDGAEERKRHPPHGARLPLHGHRADM